jgi:hypothetical protein
MEKIGARYEPEVQLRGVEVVPFTPGEEKYCTYNREEGNACVGHVSGDFGRQGDRFHSNWYNHKTRSEQDWVDVSPEFQTDLHSAVYALRQSLLKDHATMLDFCQIHPEAKLPDRNGLEHYGFKMDTEKRQYFILCFAEQDSKFIIYAYDKTSPVLEQTSLIEVLPGNDADRSMFYLPKKDSLNIGYMRGDFGKNGDEFWHSWFDGDVDRHTPEFKAEFQTVVDLLRQNAFKDLRSSQDFCYKHPKAMLPGDVHRYGFKLETETRQYFVRCTVIPNDYFYVFAYDKASPLKEQEKPSVINQIRTAQKEAKTPRKAKTPDKKKDETEL